MHARHSLGQFAIGLQLLQATDGPHIKTNGVHICSLAAGSGCTRFGRSVSVPGPQDGSLTDDRALHRVQTAAYRNRQSRQATCWVPDVQRVARQRWKLDQAFGRRLGCAACAAERITRNPDAGGWAFTGGGSVGIDPASGELQGRAIGQHEIRPRLSDNDLFAVELDLDVHDRGYPGKPASYPMREGRVDSASMA